MAFVIGCVEGAQGKRKRARRVCEPGLESGDGEEGREVAAPAACDLRGQELDLMNYRLRGDGNSRPFIRVRLPSPLRGPPRR